MRLRMFLQVTESASDGVYLYGARTSTLSPSSSVTPHPKSPTPPGLSSGLKSPTPRWGTTIPPIPPRTALRELELRAPEYEDTTGESCGVKLSN
ncbi:hypothetical protein D9611_014454 [Ephemerocybe angulata]|uniref:Uncharacterized protein n=1 Tax=Ephemerocybe angulata TaxID=980116 RepID=A0A8H5ARV8_9AGAR|nr:hypothetical protein D9611_014454 [Tulosesus angulatus]